MPRIVNPEWDQRQRAKRHRDTADVLRTIRRGPTCESHLGVKLIQDATTDSYVCPICIGLQPEESEGQAERDREYRRAGANPGQLRLF